MYNISLRFFFSLFISVLLIVKWLDAVKKRNISGISIRAITTAGNALFKVSALQGQIFSRYYAKHNEVLDLERETFGKLSQYK